MAVCWVRGIELFNVKSILGSQVSGAANEAVRKFGVVIKKCSVSVVEDSCAISGHYGSGVDVELGLSVKFHDVALHRNVKFAEAMSRSAVGTCKLFKMIGACVRLNSSRAMKMTAVRVDVTISCTIIFCCREN